MQMPSEEKLFDPNSCPVAATMSTIGGKWKLVILYAIFGGINRFGAIRREIPGVSKKMLTKELRELENAGLIDRIVFPEVPPHVEYRLTPKGASLHKVTDALRDWGQEWLHLTPYELSTTRSEASTTSPEPNP